MLHERSLSQGIWPHLDGLASKARIVHSTCHKGMIRERAGLFAFVTLVCRRHTIIDKSTPAIFKVTNGEAVLETANAIVFAAVNGNFPRFINVEIFETVHILVWS